MQNFLSDVDNRMLNVLSHSIVYKKSTFTPDCQRNPIFKEMDSLHMTAVYNSQGFSKI